MKWNICICFVFVLLDVSWAINEHFNFTYSNIGLCQGISKYAYLSFSVASRCKEHISRHGYNYDTFYFIKEDTLQHATVRRDDTDVSYFEMHIAIQAASNGHILLSPVMKPGRTDSVYEIVVGGGGNMFTELRLNLKRNAKSSAKTPKILSPIEFTAFYIKISDEGLVEFGKEGDSLPLISYHGAHTLPIKYFSFASWSGVEAKFLYDCPASDFDTSSPDSQQVAPKLSNSEELKRSLLMSKLPSVPPSPIMQVQLSVRPTHVKLDTVDSKLKIRLAVVMSWLDDGMAWNPAKYNETTSIRFRQGQIWRPMFFVFNSDNSDPFDTENPDLISVLYSGDATFHFQTEVTTWCFDTDDAQRWPRDHYTCSLVIEPWEVHEEIAIDNMGPKDNKLTVFADMDKLIDSEWKVTTSNMVIKASVWNRAYTTDDNTTHKSDRYILTVDMERQATTYNIAFYTPLLVLLVFLLLSFWSEPLEMSRVWFYAGCAVVICMGLSYIDFVIPTHSVPHLLVFYITILGGVLLAMLVQILLLTSAAEKLSNTSLVQTLVSFYLLRVAFCMPPVKTSTNGGYSRHDDVEDEACLPGGSTEELNEDQLKNTTRKELAQIIDKFMFVVYSITAAIMLAEHY